MLYKIFKNSNFIRFSFVGLISTFINLFVYYLIFNITQNISLASSLGYFTGLVNSFIFSRIWVFKVKKIKLYKSFIIFLIVYILGWLGMLIVINIMNFLGAHYLVAWLAGTCYSLVNNYIGSKKFVFINN